MIPRICRLLVQTASLIVPSAKRAEWQKEWVVELHHRAESGASGADLLRCARGVFRDAAWTLRADIKQNGFDLFARPLRAEAAFLVLALLTALIAGVFQAPHPPYGNAGRLFLFERNIALMGSVEPEIQPSVTRKLRDAKSFEGVAGYRIIRNGEIGAQVDLKFFDLLGRGAQLGRTFLEGDYDSVVLPYEVWHDRYGSKPSIVGATHIIHGRPYKVIGVMPADFWFRSRRLQFFTQLSQWSKPVGEVTRLKPGVTQAAAQTELRAIVKSAQNGWMSKAFELVPIVVDRRLSNLVFALELAGAGAIVGILFLLFRGASGTRYRLLLGARVAMVVLALEMFRLSIPGFHTVGPFSYSIFAFWIFLMLCSSSVVLLVMDHRARCPVCLGKLKRPVAIGYYSSALLDQPSTEYLCPSGCGLMSVAETVNGEDNWMALDKSWKDLFAHFER